MSTKVWTFKRYSDGAERTVSREQAMYVLYRAMHGLDPFEDEQASAPQASAPQASAPQAIDRRAASHDDLPLAA